MKKRRSSLGVKIAILALLSFLLILPSFMVMNIINERERRSETVKSEISSKWGSEQTIAGPVINVPYKAYYTTSEGKLTYSVKYFQILPEKLEVKSSISPEKRYRGIYETVVYNAALKLSGNFVLPELELVGIKPENIIWKDAALGIGIDDMKGIKNKISIFWDGKSMEANPGLITADVFKIGFSIKKIFGELPDMGKSYSFSTEININGSEGLYFIPVGKETTVNVTSPWSNPSFTGNYLPKERVVSDKGFEASWEIFRLNRNYPQYWKGQKYFINDTAFGVDLRLPVEQYQKTMRTAKYAIMFIGLTFLVYFMIEIMNRLEVHPIQYLLTGFALLIFYTLLLSISEYLNFTLSYLIASFATIVQISLYSLSIFKEKSRALIVSGVLILLYAYLFVVLQLQDFALLLGSIGLFITLGLVMYLTRKIDWSGFNKDEEISD